MDGGDALKSGHFESLPFQSIIRSMKSTDDIRFLLKNWIVRTLPHDEIDVLIDELCFIDKSRRADVVHANGKLAAFEIKSSADTLARWDGQQEAYLTCFDEVWLCCHSKHVVKALTITSASVGVIVVDDYSGLAVIRPAKLNSKINPFNLTGFLWRNELDGIAKDKRIEIRRGALIKEARQRLAGALSVDEIRPYVLAALKARYHQR